MDGLKEFAESKGFPASEWELIKSKKDLRSYITEKLSLKEEEA